MVSLISSYCMSFRFIQHFSIAIMCLGAIQVFSGKQRYEGVMFNVISVTRGWVGVQFPEK